MAANVLVGMLDVQIVLVKVECSDHEKHEQQPNQTDPQRQRRVVQCIDGMRQQIQSRHAQHDPRHETQDQLGSPVVQVQHRGNGTAKCGTDNDGTAIQNERDHMDF